MSEEARRFEAAYGSSETTKALDHLREDLKSISIRTAELGGKIDKINALLERSVELGRERNAELAERILRIEDKHISDLRDELRAVRDDLKAAERRAETRIDEVERRAEVKIDQVRDKAFTNTISIATAAGGAGLLLSFAPRIIGMLLP